MRCALQSAEAQSNGSAAKRETIFVKTWAKTDRVEKISLHLGFRETGIVMASMRLDARVYVTWWKAHTTFRKSKKLSTGPKCLCVIWTGSNPTNMSSNIKILWLL